MPTREEIESYQRQVIQNIGERTGNSNMALAIEILNKDEGSTMLLAGMKHGQSPLRVAEDLVNEYWDSSDELWLKR